jgi:hypothetical protein
VGSFRAAQPFAFGSSRRWTWPRESPAKISFRASENAQQRAALSQVKVASTVPVSKSHTFSYRIKTLAFNAAMLIVKNTNAVSVAPVITQ